MAKSGFDLDEIERLRERLGSVSSAMMEGDNLAILLCGYFDNPDQDGSDDDCGWTPDALAGYAQVCDAIHAHYAPTLTAILTEIRELRAENARLREALVRLRDCDWVISLPDRMDAVREIARAALGEPQ